MILTELFSSASGFWFLMLPGKLAGALRVALIGTMALPPPGFIIPVSVVESTWAESGKLNFLGCV